mgnify:FL=1
MNWRERFDDLRAVVSFLVVVFCLALLASPDLLARLSGGA